MSRMIFKPHRVAMRFGDKTAEQLDYLHDCYRYKSLTEIVELAI